jgi:hypothetical protein
LSRPVRGNHVAEEYRHKILDMIGDDSARIM